MAQTFTRDKLSGSTNGRAIKVVATATAGTTIHTAVSGTSSFDEVYLEAYNGHTADVTLTIEWGAATVPDDNIIQTIPFKAGTFFVARGLINNSLVIRAFASVASVITIKGWVNKIV